MDADAEERRRQREERRRQRELARQGGKPEDAPQAAAPAPAAAAVSEPTERSSSRRERGSARENGVPSKEAETPAEPAKRRAERQEEQPTREPERAPEPEREREPEPEPERAPEPVPEPEPEPAPSRPAEEPAEEAAPPAEDAKKKRELERRASEEQLLEREKQREQERLEMEKAERAHQEANQRVAQKASTFEVDGDTYEARMAARAARRAATQSVAISNPSSSGSQRGQAKPFVASGGFGASKVTATPSPALKVTDASVNQALQKKEIGAEDLAAIAEKKRLATQAKEQERKEPTRSTSQEQLKDAASPPARRKLDTSTFEAKKEEPAAKAAARPVSTATGRINTSVFEQPGAAAPPAPGATKFGSVRWGSAPKPAAAASEEPQAKPASTARSRPTTTWMQPKSTFDSPAAPEEAPKEEAPKEEAPKQALKESEPEAKAAEPAADPFANADDEYERRKAEREKRRAGGTTTTAAAAATPAPTAAASSSPFGAKSFGKGSARPTTMAFGASGAVSAQDAKVVADFAKTTEQPKAAPAAAAAAPARGSVFNRTYDAPAPAASASKPADLPVGGPKKEVLPSGRITVVTRPAAGAAFPKVSMAAAAASSSAGGGSSPSALHLFSKVHNDQKEAVLDMINLKLGSDVQLRAGNLVPVTGSNMTQCLKDGVLLCKLVNASVRNTLDERTINFKGLDDPEKVLENFQLCVNSARSVGCSIFANPADLAKGDGKKLEDLAWQIVKGGLRKRTNIEYEASGKDRCKMCNTKIEDQHGQKGNIFICMDCIEIPLNFINFFTGENALETNEVKVKSTDAKKKAGRITTVF